VKHTVSDVRFTCTLVDEDGTEHPIDQHFACVEKFEMDHSRYRNGIQVTTLTIKQKVPQVESNELENLLLKEYVEQ